MSRCGWNLNLHVEPYTLVAAEVQTFFNWNVGRPAIERNIKPTEARGLLSAKRGDPTAPAPGSMGSPIPFWSSMREGSRIG